MRFICLTDGWSVTTGSVPSACSLRSLAAFSGVAERRRELPEWLLARLVCPLIGPRGGPGCVGGFRGGDRGMRIRRGSSAGASSVNLIVKPLAAALSVFLILCAVAFIVSHIPDILY